MSSEIKSLNTTLPPPMPRDVIKGMDDTLPPPMPKYTDESCFEYDVYANGSVGIRKYIGEFSIVRIPKTIGGKPVTVIGDAAFCLTSVKVHTGPGYPTGLGTVEGGGETIETIFHDSTTVTDVFIPDGVEKIGRSVFRQCIHLRRVIIPQSVTEIGFLADNIFVGCISLKEIIVDEKNKMFCSKDGALYTRDMTRLFAYPVGKRSEYFQVPPEVTLIGEYVFQSCKNLISVTIPAGVKTIKESAFADCKNLSSVTIPGTTSFIGDRAFFQCTSLKEVKIQEGTKWIGSYAFNGCSSLQSVSIPKSVDSIGSNVFRSCPRLKDIYFGGSRSDWSTMNSWFGLGLSNRSKVPKTTQIHYNCIR